MRPDEFFVLVICATAITFAVLYARARGRIVEMERSLGRGARPVARRDREIESSGEVRIGQLENQVDQIAAQIDRLAESQDFLSRVMSDKLDRLTSGRMDTPQ